MLLICGFLMKWHLQFNAKQKQILSFVILFLKIRLKVLKTNQVGTNFWKMYELDNPNLWPTLEKLIRM